jgi:hypothetical protein
MRGKSLPGYHRIKGEPLEQWYLRYRTEFLDRYSMDDLRDNRRLHEEIIDGLPRPSVDTYTFGPDHPEDAWQHRLHLAWTYAEIARRTERQRPSESVAPLLGRDAGADSERSERPHRRPQTNWRSLPIKPPAEGHPTASDTVRAKWPAEKSSSRPRWLEVVIATLTVLIVPFGIAYFSVRYTIWEEEQHKGADRARDRASIINAMTKDCDASLNANKALPPRISSPAVINVPGGAMTLAYSHSDILQNNDPASITRLFNLMSAVLKEQASYAVAAQEWRLLDPDVSKPLAINPPKQPPELSPQLNETPFAYNQRTFTPQFKETAEKFEKAKQDYFDGVVAEVVKKREAILNEAASGLRASVADLCEEAESLKQPRP